MFRRENNFFSLLCGIGIKTHFPLESRGGSSPKLKGGGAICRVGAKTDNEKYARRRRAKIFGPFFRKTSLGFQLNNALIYMFLTIRTKHEKKLHLGQDKGRLSCRKWGAKPSFYHEGGGAVAPDSPPKSATVGKPNFVLYRGHD